jgi:biopolymer transport protein ExbD
MSLRLDAEDGVSGEMHEINVTPFIDVMLVLLIIFMIAAPLATVDIPVQLPAADAARSPELDKPLLLTLKADLSLALGENAVGRDALGSALDAASGNDHTQRVYLRADKHVPYGDLMNVMNTLRAAGYLNVALVALDGQKSP